MTFLDVDIDNLSFGLQNFNEYYNCIPTNDDVYNFKENLIFLMKKYQNILSEKIHNISSLETMNEVVHYDIICFYLWETYLYADEEFVILFNEDICEAEIVSINIGRYIEDIEYPKLLNIIYSGC